MLLKNQKNVAPQRGLPVDDVGATSVIETITDETVQLYYWNSGVRTTDAGQIAGVVVEGVLGYDNIKNSAGTMEGNKIDTSLVFTAGVFTTEVEIDEALLEALDDVTGTARATALTSGLSNGEYVVDYSNGILYGLKATTGTTLASTTYKIKVGQVGTSGTAISSNVNLAKVAGTATAVGAGAVSAGVQRTTLASDDPAVTLLGTVSTAIALMKTALDSVLTILTGVWDSVTNAFRMTEVNPLNLQYVVETLLDLTNIPETTTGYAYIDMTGYRGLGIQGETSGATPTDVLTVTYEATMQDDGTAAASCDYQDVTNVLTGSASFVDEDFISLIDTPLPVKYLRIKYTTSTGGGSDADLVVYVKKLY